MTYEDMVEISARIDDVITEKALTVSEAVHVFVFNITKMMFLLGVREEDIDDAIDAIAQDMKDGFRRIADSVEMIYEQDEKMAN
jgi:hypothetical protein